MPARPNRPLQLGARLLIRRSTAAPLKKRRSIPAGAQHPEDSSGIARARWAQLELMHRFAHVLQMTQGFTEGFDTGDLKTPRRCWRGRATAKVNGRQTSRR